MAPYPEFVEVESTEFCDAQMPCLQRDNENKEEHRCYLEEGHDGDHECGYCETSVEPEQRAREET